jgi:3-dehydroquinate dehydratase
MKAGLEVAKVMRNASPVEAPTIDLEANSDVDVAIETARKHGLLSKSTRRKIDRLDEHRRFLDEMTKFQNDARKLASHTFPDFSAMLRSFVPEEIDSEYSKHSSIEDVNHKIGQEN